MSLIDTFGRNINYLRLSVTDRCNLRCRYCMPEEGISKLKHEDILSYEDLMLVSRASVELGIQKIRITGGEPLIRNGILEFLRNLSGIPGLKQLVLTTNGILLEKMAEDLRSSGVQRVNISLDSLRPSTFSAITRCGDLNQVLRGIDAAEHAGFPIKINVVAMRGVNDDEFVEFASLTLKKPFTVRFIEYMPTTKEADWQSLVISGDEIIERIGKHFPVKPVEKTHLAGPSRDFEIDGAAGKIGIITPISGHFCTECNRIRVTSSGMAKSCLFDDTEHDLTPSLKSGSVEVVKDALRKTVLSKPHRHLLADDSVEHQAFDMSKVGG
jgi:cyclic pyranopterin phosphate synthase